MGFLQGKIISGMFMQINFLKENSLSNFIRGELFWDFSFQPFHTEISTLTRFDEIFQIILFLLGSNLKLKTVNFQHSADSIKWRITKINSFHKKKQNGLKANEIT